MDEAALEWCKRFESHLSSERRLSEHTVSNYRRDLALLRGWCDKQAIDDWADLTGKDVRAFAAAEFRRGQNPRSIARALSAARAFYRYLAREGRVTRNPVDGVRAPKASKRLPGTLDADTMAALLAIKDKRPIALRDRAMMELFYSSGLRLAELTGLDLSDVNLNDQTARLLGKGNKERIVPIGKMAAAALAAWLRVRSRFAATVSHSQQPAIFVTAAGNRISRRAVQDRVRYWARRQGIDARVYPHLFRHSCATHVLESSRDLRGVQELLGHADIGTTQIYTHLDFQHLAQIYDEAHPRARRNRD
ncbi:MAG: tyrosine recombinase XerC [Pseudomonadota bacterium]